MGTIQHRQYFDGNAVGAASRLFCDGYRSKSSTASLPQINSEGISMPISRGPYARNIRGQSPQEYRLSNIEVATLASEALKATYSDSKSAMKEAANDANQSPRAAENWFAGENPMSLTAFLNLYLNNDKFRAYARKMLLMEKDHNPQFQAELARFMTAVVRERG